MRWGARRGSATFGVGDDERAQGAQGLAMLVSASLTTRARAVAAGELPDPEGDARAYLEAEPGKLRVFRCPDCEVRVAQEADLCRSPSLSRGVLAGPPTVPFQPQA